MYKYSELINELEAQIAEDTYREEINYRLSGSCPYVMDVVKVRLFARCRIFRTNI